VANFLGSIGKGDPIFLGKFVMVQSELPIDRSVRSKLIDAIQQAASNTETTTELSVSEEAAAAFVLKALPGSVLTLGGIDRHTLRAHIDEVEPEQCNRRVLFVPIQAAVTTEAIVEQIVRLLAEAASRLWPVWFTNVSFGAYRNDTLGRTAAGATVRKLAHEIDGLSPSWADAAVRLMLAHRLPRVKGAQPATELTQLTLAINRSGLVLLVDIDAAVQADANAAIVVHALEWVAQHSRAAVVGLFSKLPPNEPPFDRILYGARSVNKEICAEPCADPEVTRPDNAGPWIAPWRGVPHPLSAIEQRLHAALTADGELSKLFHFNLPVDTVRGSRPRVDLVWPEGRFVVELDGYGSHGNRAAFIYDRHRDYELTLSGYTVLRLANDEIAQDAEKALEKIRNLVRMRRMQIGEEK
jgi:very-short-patch-repair endonuclease